ncbi:MAG: hypothetical protein JWQ43_2686 [Glaciihabitans sp.]|nr:hypothetical protein [Glaciihabitans sp.]
MTKSRQPRPRRARSVTEMLLSIVLVLEAVLVFFVTLTVYGLDVLTPALAFGGGAALLVVQMITTQLLRFHWGMWIGWGLQVALLATGLLLPAMYIVAAVFVAMWVYCYIRGQQIDRQKFGRSVDTP